MPPSSRAQRAVVSSVVLIFLGACGVRSALSGGAPVGRDAAVDDGGTSMQQPIEILPPTLPGGRTRVAYARTLTARGGVGAPYVFSVSAGALPPGLALGASGELAGTPRRAGTYAFTVRATDGAGDAGQRAYTLTISGPRWMAFTTFISTTSQRSAVLLVDYTKPSSTPIVLNEDRANHPRFSPDGSLFSYTTGVAGPVADAFIVDVSGETPGTPFRLLDTGHVTNGADLAWSPDSKRIAYVRTDGTHLALFVADVSAGGVSARTMLTTDVASRSVVWDASGAIVFYDGAKRPTIIRFVAGVPVRVTFDVPDGWITRLSPDGARAFLSDPSGGFALGDVTTGAVTPIPANFERFDVSPDFAVVLGRSRGSSSSGLYDVDGTSLGVLLRASVGVDFFADVSWAHARPLLAQSEAGRLVVVDYGAPQTTITLLPGTYPSARSPAFSSDGSLLAFGAGTDVWASTVNGRVVAAPARVASASSNAMLSFAPSALRLLVLSGTTAAHVIDFESVVPAVREVTSGIAWFDADWSTDSTFISVVGSASSNRRVQYLVDLDDPAAPPRLVASCPPGTVGSTPQCPNTQATFQP